jgi:hypothetical protein
MSFRRFILAITMALTLAFSMNIATDTANACDPTGSPGWC